jgi:hypothetical protein
MHQRPQIRLLILDINGYWTRAKVDQITAAISKNPEEILIADGRIDGAEGIPDRRYNPES